MCNTHVKCNCESQRSGCQIRSFDSTFIGSIINVEYQTGCQSIRLHFDIKPNGILKWETNDDKLYPSNRIQMASNVNELYHEFKRNTGHCNQLTPSIIVTNVSRCENNAFFLKDICYPTTHCGYQRLILDLVPLNTTVCDQQATFSNCDQCVVTFNSSTH